MTTSYDQKSGSINHNGEFWGAAYSGHGAGLNNPAAETIEGVGPIPRGEWRIVEWFDEYENKGPVVARLEPVGHDAFGRSGFLIHGDNVEMDHTASDGCIVAARDIREKWRASGDTEIMVI